MGRSKSNGSAVVIAAVLALGVGWFALVWAQRVGGWLLAVGLVCLVGLLTWSRKNRIQAPADRQRRRTTTGDYLSRIDVTRLRSKSTSPSATVTSRPKPVAQATIVPTAAARAAARQAATSSVAKASVDIASRPMPVAASRPAPLRDVTAPNGKRPALRSAPPPARALPAATARTIERRNPGAAVRIADRPPKGTGAVLLNRLAEAGIHTYGDFSGHSGARLIRPDGTTVQIEGLDTDKAQYLDAWRDAIIESSRGL